MLAGHDAWEPRVVEGHAGAEFDEKGGLQQAADGRAQQHTECGKQGGGGREGPKEAERVGR